MSSTTSRIQRSTLRLLALTVIAAAALTVTGCSANFGDMKGGQLQGNPEQGAALQGRVFGGNLPITGATVQLYAVGTTGYGSAATPLITGTAVTTQTGGIFNISTDYSCPAGAYVYLTVSGGNPGLAANNPAIALMTALGPCSRLLLPSSDPNSIGFINVNELTTVAAVWTLQQFGGTTNGTPLSATPYSATTPVAASDTFGTSATNTQGIANAMSLANVLVNFQSGVTPSANTSGNQVNVEYWQINTIADILAICINSDGGSASPCTTLFSNTGGAADTIQAALYMAKNPASNVATLTGLVTGTGQPFTPSDTSTNDFTIGLSYSTGTTATRWIAMDEYGNAWITAGTSVAELDPAGNKISTSTSYTLASTSTPIGTAYEVAVDTSNNAWVTDQSKTAIFEVLGSTSAGGAPTSGAGTAVSTSSVSTSTTALEAVVVDGSNNVWASISAKNIVGLLNGNYSTLVTGGTAGTTNSSPFGMAVDLSNQPTSPNFTLSNGGSFLYAINSGGCASVSGGMLGGSGTFTAGSIDMDYAKGNGSTIAAGASTPLNYIVDALCNNTSNVPNNTTHGTPYAMMSTPYGIAVDNNNNLWIVNQNYVSTTDTTSPHYSLAKVTTDYTTGFGAGTANGATGKPNITFQNFGGGGLSAPFYLAMDGASAAWVANSTGFSVNSTPIISISAFTNSGTAISPNTGLYGGIYGTGATASRRLYNSPRGIAVDGSGNVWVANTGTTTFPGTSSAVGYVTVTIGAATPTVTPLSLGIAGGTLASKP